MTEVLLVLMVIPLGGFAYRYARYSPWQSTIQGRTLLTQKIATLALVVFFISAAVFPDYPGRELVKDALLFVLTVLFWVMFVSLLWIQTAIKPVSRKRGTGYVKTEDLERTQPRPLRRKK